MPSWTSTEPQRDRAINRRMLIEGIALGAVYGLFLRAVVFLNKLQHHGRALADFNIVMTVGFLFFGPAVLGFLVVRRAECAERTSAWLWIFAPWISATLMLLCTIALYWEGFICVLMALPVALVCGSIGGVIAGLLCRQRRPSTATTVCVAFLPLLLGIMEARSSAPLQTRTVQSEIHIQASVQTVWQNIERVPAITPAELHPNWTHRIGFPRPIEATLSYEGVGGIRHATFERGVLFIETITAWQPQQRLAFTIKADSPDIPLATLDEHVTIGGRYFDVLDGEYRIEPLSDGGVLLHLTSHQRLSTDFNVYAGLWTDAVMQNLQTSILQVIQHRCESQSAINSEVTSRN